MVARLTASCPDDGRPGKDYVADLLRLAIIHDQIPELDRDDARALQGLWKRANLTATRALLASRCEESRWIHEPSKVPRPKAKKSPKPVPPMVEDHSCCDPLKPDPSTASTLEDLRELLHDFWKWSGQPSTRRVAAASQGAFSHTTLAKLLKDTGQVPLTLEYVRGLVLGCGGDSCEVARWATAWRQITMNRTTVVRPLRVVNEQ